MKIKIKKKNRTGLALIKYNFLSIILFEIMYKGLAVFILTPILTLIFNMSIKLANYQYLSNDNLFTFLFRPSSLIILSFVLVFFAIFILVEIMAMVGCFHSSYHNKRISPLNMLRMGMIGTTKALKPKNSLMVLWVIFIMPLANSIYLFGMINTIKIPNFVSKFLEKNSNMIIIASTITILLSMLSLWWIFCAQGILLEGKKLKDAKKNSIQLMKGKYSKTFAKFAIWNVIIVLFLGILLILTGKSLFTILKYFGIEKNLYIIALRTNSSIIRFFIFFYIMFFVPIMIAFTSEAYYKRKILRGEKIDTFEKPAYITKHPVAVRRLLIFCIGLLLLNSARLFLFQKDKLVIQAELFQQIEVIAHRGDSKEAPENTIAAIESAIDSMADWIEIDVQQTKDGTIVVLHDSNLKRVAGVNKNIWQVTYDEIKHLDVGSWFDPIYAEEKIPTLDEVLKLTKGKIKINIELKPNGFEKDFEKNVIDVIMENKFEKDCLISSMKYNSLKRVKKLNPDIKTAHVVIVIYNDFWNSTAADAFSIERTFITREMVNNIKSAGKEVYVWTVNGEKNIQKMINLGVDGIITDQPLLAQELVLSQYAVDPVWSMIEE